MSDLSEQMNDIWNPPIINDDQDEMEYMVTTIIPSIITLFDSNKFLKTDNGRTISGPYFIVGINKRLFTIEPDFQVGELKDIFTSIGSGSYFAKGAMKVIIDIKGRNNPIDILEDALDISNHFSPSVGNEFEFLSTNDH